MCTHYIHEIHQCEAHIRTATTGYTHAGITAWWGRNTLKDYKVHPCRC